MQIFCFDFSNVGEWSKRVFKHLELGPDIFLHFRLAALKSTMIWIWSSSKLLCDKILETNIKNKQIFKVAFSYNRQVKHGQFAPSVVLSQIIIWAL